MLRRCVSAGERKFAWRVFIRPPEHVLGWGAWLHANDKPDQNEQSECSHSTAGSGEPGMVVPILGRSIIHCNGEPPLGTANIFSQRQGCLTCEFVLPVRTLASGSAAGLCTVGILFHLRHSSCIRCGSPMRMGRRSKGPPQGSHREGHNTYIRSDVHMS
jgi:hypothetical protein